MRGPEHRYIVNCEEELVYSAGKLEGQKDMESSPPLLRPLLLRVADQLLTLSPPPTGRTE